MSRTGSISIAAALLATGILLSRLLGYVREMLLAGTFGAGPETDAFYAAFQIPDLLNYFLSGGALSIAFIPLYNKVLARDGKKAAEDMTAAVLGTLGVLAAAATAVLVWQAEPLVRLQFPRFDAPTTALTVQLTRIVLPAQVFFVMGGIVQAVLMAQGRFVAAAVAPLVYNACIIAGGVLLQGPFGIAGFAFGTLAGGVLGPFLVPVLFSRGHMTLRARFAPLDKSFRIYLLLALPLMLGQTLLTLDEWYGRWFGALLEAGTVAHLSYARRLMQIPIAVIGQAVAVAALPALSRLWAENKVKEKNKLVQATLEAGTALAVLAGAGTWALARPGVDLVYRHGAFTGEDAATVSALVALFAFAVPGWIVQQIAVRAFYARGDTWRPMALGTVLSLAVIPLYLFLSGLMEARGIALAGAIAMTLNALATLAFSRWVLKAPLPWPLALSFARALAVAAPAAAAARGVIFLRQAFYPAADAWGIKAAALLDLALGGSAFALVALPCVFWLGDEALRGAVMKIVQRLKLIK